MNLCVMVFLEVVGFDRIAHWIWHKWTFLTYLDVFSIQMLVQWKTLDRALIPGMEGPELGPFVGWISVDKPEMFPCTHFHNTFEANLN